MKASELNQAAETIEREAVRYEGMVLAAQVLKSIGSLKNATEEAERARNEANAERDKALKELGEAKQDVEATKKLIETYKNEAAERGATIILEAQDKAAKITAEAEAQAKQTRQAEAETREKDLKNLNEKIVKATETLEGVQSLTLGARQDAAAADQLREEAEAGLAKVQKQIEKLGQKVA